MSKKKTNKLKKAQAVVNEVVNAPTNPNAPMVLFTGNANVVDAIYGIIAETNPDSLIFCDTNPEDSNLLDVLVDNASEFATSIDKILLLIVMDQLALTGRLIPGTLNYTPDRETMNMIRQSNFAMSVRSNHDIPRAMNKVFLKCGVPAEDVVLVKLPLNLQQPGFCDNLLIAFDLDAKTMNNLNKNLTVSAWGRKIGKVVDNNRPFVSGAANVIMEDVAAPLLSVGAEVAGEVIKGTTNGVAAAGVAFLKTVTTDNRINEIVHGDDAKQAVSDGIGIVKGFFGGFRGYFNNDDSAQQNGIRGYN